MADSEDNKKKDPEPESYFAPNVGPQSYFAFRGPIGPQSYFAAERLGRTGSTGPSGPVGMTTGPTPFGSTGTNGIPPCRGCYAQLRGAS